MNYGYYAEKVAQQKLGIAGWKAYLWQVVDLDSGIFRLKGGIPKVITRGSHKGEDSWRGVSTDTVYVTKQECINAQNKYEAETGNCGNCWGKGQELAGYSVFDGERYRECGRCKGNGKTELTQKRELYSNESK